MKPISYLSVCSGIEAATQAWHPLGWAPAAFSEIETFPSAVLAHHYGSNMPGEDLTGNGVPNLGDMNKFKDWPDYDIDLLVGGTPCQSFSVAGLRKGLEDPRGNLMLTYAAIARRYRPRWVVWENVPGVLSSNRGRDFGTFLRALAECGYGFAYRVLDAQFVRVDGFGRAVPQRRRRVFVVGYLGDWRRAAAVLFEPESLRGDPPPRRQAGQAVAPTTAIRPTGGGGLGTDFDLDGGLIAADVASTLNAAFGSKQGLEDQHINSGAPLFVAHALRGEGFDASEDGTGRGTPLVPVAYPPSISGTLKSCGGKSGQPNGAEEADRLVPVAFSSKDYGGDAESDLSPTLRAGGHDGSHANAGVPPAVAYRTAGDGAVYEEGEITAPLTTATDPNAQIVADRWAVRRLTPTECERLMGFPDGYTDIPWRGKGHSPDGPRYKALGNSMAVNVMRWIGRRIEMVDTLYGETKDGIFG